MSGEMFYTTLPPPNNTSILHEPHQCGTNGLQVWNTWNASVAEMIEFQSYPQKYPSMKIMREI